jgi:hypothetical protein
MVRFSPDEYAFPLAVTVTVPSEAGNRSWQIRESVDYSCYDNRSFDED